MSERTPNELAEKIYVAWHSSDQVESQRSLARAFGLTPSTTSHIVKGAGDFSELKKKFPDLQRTDAERKAGRPAKSAAELAEEAPVLEPEIDLAAETIEALPNLKPQVAVVLAKNCFSELSELLRLVNAPLCPRLAKILGPHPGRPAKNQKDEDSARQAAEEELAECERASKEFLEERIK